MTPQQIHDNLERMLPSTPFGYSYYVRVTGGTTRPPTVHSSKAAITFAGNTYEGDTLEGAFAQLPPHLFTAQQFIDAQAEALSAENYEEVDTL